MNPAQAQASGTKPGQLDSTIPGANEQQSSEAGAEQSLKQLGKEKKSQAPEQGQEQTQQQAQPSSAEQVFLNDSDVQQPPQQQGQGSRFSQLAPPGQSLIPTAAGVADTVQQGIPAVVSAAGSGLGALVGSVVPGVGTGFGAEIGYGGAAALNTAL